jgi:hypothetical protein
MVFWVLLIVSILLTVVKVLFGDKIVNTEEKKQHKHAMGAWIKNKSKETHFTFEECTFTSLDTIKKERRWKRSKSKSLGIDRKRQHDEVTTSKTKITCSRADTKREFVSTFPIDIATAKIKTQQNNGITVYFEEEEDEYTGFGEEEYYMDLGFLEPQETNT